MEHQDGTVEDGAGPRIGGPDYDQTEVKALVLDLESGRWSRAERSGLPWRAATPWLPRMGR